jgi:hypothetical protein
LVTGSFAPSKRANAQACQVTSLSGLVAPLSSRGAHHFYFPMMADLVNHMFHGPTSK